MADRKSGGSALGRLKARLKAEGSLGRLSKSTKKRLSRPGHAAAAEPVDVVNPFEIKVNRQKHAVLGKKREGDLRGMPGQSRLRAMEQREKTLLVEHKRKGKVSAVIDQRFGERDATMTEEEKMVARFAKERAMRKRKAMFNLDDADDFDDLGSELTHMGKALSELDDLNDAPRGHDDDEDDSGQTDASIVRRAHFGGFEDEEDEDEGEEGEGRKKTKREVMRELIAKSKMYKMERQAQRDEDLQAIERLDADLGLVKELLGDQLRPKGSKEIKKRQRDEDPEEDEYDALLRDMAKERRAKPTDRLKTAEELAREEYLKLERLEQDRQRRMKGLDDAPLSGVPDESGDSLDTNIAISRKDRNRGSKAIEYKDGKLIVSEAEQAALEEEARLRRRAKARGGVTAEDDDRGGEGFLDSDEEEDEENQDEEEKGEESGDEDDDEDEDEEEGDENDDDEDEDDDDDDEQEEEDDEEEEHEAEVKKRRRRVELLGVVSDDSDMEDEAPRKSVPSKSNFSSSSLIDPAARNAMIAAAQSEVPYLFKDAPATHTAFMAIVAGRPVSDVVTVVSRMRAQFHISLGPNNRAKLQALYGVLLEHIEYDGDASSGDPALVDALLTHLRELAEVSQEAGAQAVLGRMRAMKHAITDESTGAVRVVSLGHIALARALLLIYPTSDFRHAVVTPLLLLLGNVLSFGVAADTAAHARQLAIAALVLDAHATTRRYAPEAVVALGRIARDLISVKAEKGTLSQLFSLRDGDTEHRGVLAYCCADVIVHAAQLYAPSLTAFDAVFLPLASFIEPFAPEAAAKVRAMSDEIVGKRAPLQWQRHKPVAIKEYNPRFDVKYTPGRPQRDVNPDRSETRKLKALVKKEKKGALRELRLDNAFMADVKRKEKKAKDEEYNARIKSVHAMINAEQQGLSKEERMYNQRKKAKK